MAWRDSMVPDRPPTMSLETENPYAASDSRVPSASSVVSGLTALCDRLYSSCLALADGVLAHRGMVLLIGVPLLTLLLVGINQLVLQDFPNSGDEYVYLYQAATLTAGRLWNEAPLQPEAFAFNYVVHEGDRVWGSFPIGWPLLLALAMALRAPVWLVNPILGTLSLLLVACLGQRLHNARVGVLAALVMGTSAFFLFNAASYFSHTFCGALLVGAACLAAREDRTSPWVPMGVGFLLGWAVLTRYYTGVICGVAIVAWLLRSGVVRTRTLALCGLGGVPWVALLLAYNSALTGSPWELTTTPVTYSRWFASGWALRGADIWSTQLLRFAQWTPPFLIAVYVVYLRVAAKEVRRGALDWMLVLMAATLYFYVERGGNQYGPRFYYEVFPFLVIFVTANLFREPRFGDASIRDRIAFGLIAASVAVMPIWFAVHAVIEHQVIAERTDPYKQVRDAGLTHALVLIGGRVGTRRSMAAMDLTRNGIDFSGEVLYGLDISPADNCRLVARYPTRRPFLYVWDWLMRRGVLAPIVCPSDVMPPAQG